jgi:hypothetical protein
MEPAKIRHFVEARPFVPFKLDLPSDRELNVPHPEFISISPAGNGAVVWRRDGIGEHIDLRWVISVKAKNSGTKRH